MDSELDRHFLESAATDLFRRVCLLEVDIGGGRTIPLSEILEAEARARCERLLRGHIEALSKQSDMSDHLERESLRLKGTEKPVDLVI
jgi:hypothetical protein